MENGKQIQKAGENSHQIQAQTVIVNQGISEERVRIIFSEMLPYALQEYTCDAYAVASQRIGKLESNILPKLDKVDGLLQAFADPAFQILLRKAQQASAATEREDDYALLSELLVCHVQKGTDRKNRTGIHRAVEIVDQIDNDALCALTVAHSVVRYIPTAGGCKEGLGTIDALFSRLMYQALPTGTEWLDHLDILGAVRISTIGTMKKLSERYPTLLDGYVCVGIKTDSDDYKKAVELLTEVNINSEFLVPNECLEGYVRLNIRNEDVIDSLSFNQGAYRVPLTDNQINTIKQIWKLYSKDTGLKKEATDNFMRLWDSYDSLRQLRIWWDNIPNAFQITRVGEILAHTNAKRCSSNIPDLI